MTPARRDANHAEIAQALRTIGCRVIDLAAARLSPDLLARRPWWPDLGARLVAAKVTALYGPDYTEARYGARGGLWSAVISHGIERPEDVGYGPTPDAAVSALEAALREFLSADAAPPDAAPVSDGKTVTLPLPAGPLPHASPDIVPPLDAAPDLGALVSRLEDAWLRLCDSEDWGEGIWTPCSRAGQVHAGIAALKTRVHGEADDANAG